MRSRWHRLGSVVALVALVATTGCGAFASNRGDDTLVIYSGRAEDLIAPLIKMFEKTGVEVEVRYGGSAELAAQLLEEGTRTKADVFLSQDAGALGAVAGENLLRPLGESLLTKVAERYRSPERWWVGVSGRARVVAYNADRVATRDLPRSVFDLTAPRWKGRVGFPPTNASFQAFVTAMRLTAGDARTRAWLTALKANNPKHYDNNVLTLEAVDKGEVDVGLVNHYYLHERIAELGATKVKAKNHFLRAADPGALVNVAAVGVLSPSDNEAALRFVDYLLGAEAQTYFRDKTFEYPLAAGVSAAPGLPPLASIQGPDIDLADLASLDATLALLNEVGLT